MKSTVRMSLVLTATVLTVGLGIAGAFVAFDQIDDAAAQRAHTKAVISLASNLLSQLGDAETGQRGYVLTGDEAFLQPYVTSRPAIPRELAELHRMTSVRAACELLDRLSLLVDAKTEELAITVAMRRSGNVSEVVERIASGRGQRLMDSIRGIVARFIQIESDALERNEARFATSMRSLFVALVGASVFVLGLALALVRFARREASNRLQALEHQQTRHLLAAREESNAILRSVNDTLQRSEENLAVTLRSIGDGVITTDAFGAVTLLNPVAETLTGWTSELAMHRPVNEIFQIISEKTREPSTVPVAAALERGVVQGLANHTVLIARNGDERSIADSCAPIRDRDEKVVGAVLVFRDVTAEYAAQRAALDDAEMIRAILDTATDGILTIRADGRRIVTANPAVTRMFGAESVAIVGRDVALLITGFEPERMDGPGEARDVHADGAGGRRQQEVVGRRPDGSVFPVEMVISDMWLDGARHFTAVLRDITARKHDEAERAEAAAERGRLVASLRAQNLELARARTEADRANLAKTEFLASMSHELRSPLNAVLGFAQLMQTDVPPPTAVQMDSIRQILKAGWHLLTLINEVLDLGQIESRTVRLSVEPVSLGEVIGECRDMIKPAAQAHEVELRFPRVGPELYVAADRTRLKQILINLLSNAVKYNTRHGFVEVTCTEAAPGRVRVSVRDAGPGLLPEQVANLFQAFNRLGREAGSEEGTGIGLVVAKQLVELMGGRIGAESVSGSGSVFWFELGLTEEPRFASERPGAAVATGERESSVGGVRTILYVEDNPANLKLVERLVERRMGWRLLTAVNGEEGILVARASQPDLILMDINLPGMSGFEAMKILRADPTAARIPIIALTANAMPRDVKRGVEAGFYGYLTKPIDVVDFQKTIEDALRIERA